MAVLVVKPQTRTIRAALYPLIVLLALRAAIPVDIISLKSTERKFHHNAACCMYVMTFRALGWAFAEEPLVRHLRPINSTPSTLYDALDLMFNFRGYGWDWSRGVHIPCETRPSNRTGFVFYTCLSATLNVSIYAGLHAAIRSFIRTGVGQPIFYDSYSIFRKPICTFFPVGLGDNSPGSIFDNSLPTHLRFIRSSIISFFILVWIYAGLQVMYDLCTITAVLILGHDPVQWPPAFDAPWRATSLTEFWARKWQQWFRDLFLVQAGYPLAFLFGRAGLVIGVFFASAIYHHLGLVTFNSKCGFWRMLVGFGMMALGIIIEHVFKYVTGRRVRGIIGWFWTMGWILLWGHMIVESYARAGLFGQLSLIDLIPPVRMFVEHMVAEFDMLLHTISTLTV